MQTSVQMDCVPNADTTDTPMESQTSLLEGDTNVSVVDHDDKLVISLEETGEEANKTITTGDSTQKVEPNQLEKLSKPNLNSESNSVSHDDNLKAKDAQPKNKKQSKTVRDGRKYVPSKKAMTDPLKIDMSKPHVVPLTSSQISLQCIECHIIFSDHKGKERHLKSSHPAEYEQSILRNALFVCYVCDRHFTNSAELKTHQKTHPEKKPFKCLLCSQTFCKLSELTIHKKIHFERDGYNCTDCGKPCKTLTLLKYHLRTHTGERPYVCKECGKRFSMPKALQKHINNYHLPEGAQPKNDGAPLVIYTCFVCEATFKSTKTRNYHMKTKHNVLKTTQSKTRAQQQQVNQCTPIITPISISQPSLLQVGPNGPLQKVDANIDTEQIRKLIESLGNVQKVNQVVILGQVPPDAPPLEVHQLSDVVQPPTLNINSTQFDFMGLNSKTNEITEDPMEQTIILEPITPDGQLLNPPLSALDSTLGANPVAEVMVFQQPTGPGTNLHRTHEMGCHNNVMGQNLEPNLDQTFVLELTPALTPTAELEHSGNILQAELPSSISEQMKELERPPVEASLSEQETSMSVQSLMSTVELELMPTQADTQIIPACPFIPEETLSKNQTETETQDEPDSLMQIKNIDHAQAMTDIANQIEEGADKATSEQVITESEPTSITKEEQDNNHIEKNAQMEEKQVEQTSEFPINVMSAQELVKVRKRKPPKAFFFQGYMQEFVSSIYDDFQNNSRAAKRKKTKKSNLVVEFSPPCKEKKSKKESKTSKQPTQKDLKGKSPTQLKIQKKGRKAKNVVNSECPAEIEVRTSLEDQDVKPKQKDTSKKKKKKQTVGTKKNEKHMNGASSVFKKKQKKNIQQSQSNNLQEKTIRKVKQKKVLDKEKDKSSTQGKAESGAELHVMQDSLLLLKGHKQPQLKVHKLDHLKASGKTQEALFSDPQTSPKGKESSVSPVSSGLSSENKKKRGRSKKTLTLLSSLHTSKKQDDAMPPKRKPTRKRKATANVETEGVITAKKGLECKDCGQRFCDVLLLQNHKATVHVVESPGITFTNGNLFEGVTRIDLYQLPKQGDKGIRDSSTSWDTESGMGDVDREHCVSFPVLNSSPSLPVPPCDDYCTYNDKVGNDSGDDGLHANPSRVFTPPPQIQAADKDKKSSTDTEVQATTDEDIKDDLVLEVDLVTVGEQSVKDDLTPAQDEPSQNKEMEPAHSESDISQQAVKKINLTLHTVSCSTHQVDIKDEDEEMVIQKNKGGIGVRSTESACEKQGAGHLNKGFFLDEGSFSEKGTMQKNSEALYERNASSNNTQVDIHHIQDTSEISAEKVCAPASVLSFLREGLKEQAVVAQELATSRTEKEPNEPSDKGEDDNEQDSSPGIILEKVLTSVHPMTADKRKSLTLLLEHDNQDIKFEGSNGSTQVGTSFLQPPHHDIMTVLVKEESTLQTNEEHTPDEGGHIQGNADQNSSENSSSPFNEAMESTDCCVVQDFNSSQCIFYPVKQEESEVLVGAAGGCRPLSSGATGVTHLLEHPTAGTEAEWQAMPNLSDFLLQNSDEEDCSYEMSDSHVDSEAEIMDNFYKKLNTLTNQSDVGLTASTLVQEKGGNSATNQPIDYFSKYFNSDLWQEISHCTNKFGKMSNSVTVREVAQFVGIHIAMGTLKYPSSRLYWEELTKVPLVADTMPWSRFLELSRILKLASPQDNQRETDTRREGINNYSVNTDPLWKIQPILQYFARGCHSLREQGHYAIDQYPLPLTGKTHSNRQSLYCRTLVTFDGIVLHVDLKSDLSDNGGVAEKMVPKGSMFFLCKQELSTPAMLEHLLEAGILGAGRVGDARGQIGSEFVSADGKLMLNSSHCGFILSTTGDGQRNIDSMINNFQKAQISTYLNKALQNLYSIQPTAVSMSCWPQTVLWYLTDLALVNSWLQYREDARNLATPLTLLAFRLEVSKALIRSSGSDAQDSLPSQPQAENAHTTNETPNPRLLDENPLPDAATRYDGLGHWPEQLSEGEGGRCRFGDCQRTSRVLCLKCCVFLCISRNHNCFLNFHSQGHQGKD